MTMEMTALAEPEAVDVEPASDSAARHPQRMEALLTAVIVGFVVLGVSIFSVATSLS